MCYTLITMCDEFGMSEERIRELAQAELYNLTPYDNSADYPDEPEQWVVGADLRACFGMPEDNYPVEDLIKAQLAERLPALGARLTFDSEFSCFFAYAKSKADADDLVSFIIGLVAQGLQAV